MYLGIDPTSTSLHLGHGENIILLEEFRSLGHEVFIVIGDFTAKIGDPSGLSGAREPLSDKTIKKNIEHILKQVRPLLDFNNKSNSAQIVYNSSWLSKLSFEEVLDLAAQFTVQQVMERDMFKRRLKDKKPIFLHEFLYPLMQGYDSVALEVDVEMGGTDQIFNMLAGRTLLRKIKDKEKFVVAVTLIANPKTGELMSKSSGAGVFIDSSPEEMFGQIMAQPDEMIPVLLTTNTRVPKNDVDKMVSEAKKGGAKAKNIKLDLAEEIVAIYHSKKEAKKARREFIRTFSKKGFPRDAPIISVKKSPIDLLSLVIESKLVSSKSEAKRLIESKAVEINGKVKRDPKEQIDINESVVLRVGKKRFVRIVRS